MAAVPVEEVATAGHVAVGDNAAGVADCEHSCTCMRIIVVVDVVTLVRDFCGCSMPLLIIFMVAFVLVLDAVCCGDDLAKLWRLIELSGDINMIAVSFVCTWGWNTGRIISNFSSTSSVQFVCVLCAAVVCSRICYT